MCEKTLTDGNPLRLHVDIRNMLVTVTLSANFGYQIVSNSSDERQVSLELPLYENPGGLGPSLTKIRQVVDANKSPGVKAWQHHKLLEEPLSCTDVLKAYKGQQRMSGNG